VGIKRFALIGAAGYVSPKHMKAIKEVGGELVVACDLNDSVGILDSYFPECEFFTREEEFINYIKRNNIDFLSICTPNHMHMNHCLMGLNLGVDVICEKPLVVEDWNLSYLKIKEQKTGKKIYNVVQLRYDENIILMKEKYKNIPNLKVNIIYFTPRGKWYDKSWKNDIDKSGGIITNIGIHLFDLLLWMFGDVKSYSLYNIKRKSVSGYLYMERVIIHFFLSIDPKHDISFKPLRFMSILGDLDDDIIDLDNLPNLHTDVYKNILKGNGYGIEDIEKSIKLTYEMGKEIEKSNVN